MRKICYTSTVVGYLVTVIFHRVYNFTLDYSSSSKTFTKRPLTYFLIICFTKRQEFIADV